MKKILLTLIICLCLIGCGDKNYIQAVKTIELNQNLTVSNVKLNSVEDVVTFIFSKLTGENYAYIKEKINYKINGKLDKNIRMVEAEFKGAIVSIPVEKKGDFYYIEPLEIRGKFENKKYNTQDIIQEMIEEEYNKSMKEFNKSMDEFNKMMNEIKY